MSQSTQAHLSRTVNKNEPLNVRQQTLSQMQYYMGAKLIEVRVDPQKVMYRWSIENKNDKQICTLSAFWGDSRAKLLSGEHPLNGEELINCARANKSAGIEMTAMLCGYAKDFDHFREALQQTIVDMGLEETPFAKLIG